ncbi:MAG: hypothetical protein COB67_05155 [SAR324 cluster bacterium]|uniref:FxsA family protein n=1 Tax=SAR324 cluster bacterium TaxID=2024889 RepID=A0A2A4T5Y6_9DELT|nr:MAG: hypothetical protein COB67_05155 [SAR324 cluster bacterium]
MILGFAVSVVSILTAIDLFLMTLASSQAGILILIISQLLSGILGCVLLKRADIYLLFYIANRQNQQLPVIKELWEEALGIFACLLLCIPGYLSDLLGIFLLLSPVRKQFLQAFSSRFSRKFK